MPLRRNQLEKKPNDLNLLCLSTAEQGCSLAVISHGELVCEEYWSAKQTHSKRLVGMVDHMLEHRAQMGLEGIDFFVSARGPGSFTGLRIGISVIKGLAYAMGKTALGVSSLDGIAYRHAGASTPVCAMMDARRNEVYCAIYRFENGSLVSKSPERVISPEKAAALVCEPAVYAGSGSKAYSDLILDTAKQPVLGDPFLDFVSAGALVRSLTDKEDFLNSPDHILTPSYIRKSDAELQFVEK